MNIVEKLRKHGIGSGSSNKLFQLSDIEPVVTEEVVPSQDFTFEYPTSTQITRTGDGEHFCIQVGTLFHVLNLSGTLISSISTTNIDRDSLYVRGNAIYSAFRASTNSVTLKKFNLHTGELLLEKTGSGAISGTFGVMILDDLGEFGYACGTTSGIIKFRVSDLTVMQSANSTTYQSVKMYYNEGFIWLSPRTYIDEDLTTYSTGLSPHSNINDYYMSFLDDILLYQDSATTICYAKLSSKSVILSVPLPTYERSFGDGGSGVYRLGMNNGLSYGNNILFSRGNCLYFNKDDLANSFSLTYSYRGVKHSPLKDVNMLYFSDGAHVYQFFNGICQVSPIVKHSQSYTLSNTGTIIQDSPNHLLVLDGLNKQLTAIEYGSSIESSVAIDVSGTTNTFEPNYNENTPSIEAYDDFFVVSSAGKFRFYSYPCEFMFEVDCVNAYLNSYGCVVGSFYYTFLTEKTTPYNQFLIKVNINTGEHESVLLNDIIGNSASNRSWCVIHHGGYLHLFYGARVNLVILNMSDFSLVERLNSLSTRNIRYTKPTLDSNGSLLFASSNDSYVYNFNFITKTTNSLGRVIMPNEYNTGTIYAELLRFYHLFGDYYIYASASSTREGAMTSSNPLFLGFYNGSNIITIGYLQMGSTGSSTVFHPDKISYLLTKAAPFKVGTLSLNVDGIKKIFKGYKFK